MITSSDKPPAYGFLPARWEERHRKLYAHYANLICIVLMILSAPTDFLSFPRNEAWAVVEARALGVMLFLFFLVCVRIVGQRPQAHPVALDLLLVGTTVTINGLYLYFLLTLGPEHRLPVTTGCLTAILGTHLFLYKFRRAHDVFSLVFLISILILAAQNSVWQSFLISIFLGHVTGFVLSLFFRKVFHGSLRKDYKIKLQAEALQQQSEKIEADFRDKDTLLRVLIHDIATPLTVITLSRNSLQQSGVPFDPETHKALERIQKACESLNHLVTHVKTTEGIRSGKVQLAIGPCSVHEAVDGAILMLEPQALAKQVRFVIERNHREDLYCIADQINLTHQVLANILSNALKFSPIGGKVTVTIQKREDTVEIRVRDQGAGIPDSILPHIFHQRRSTSRPGTAGEIGTGFGLPLAKAYVDRFQGQIRIETETRAEACGTTITLILPYGRSI